MNCGCTSWPHRHNCPDMLAELKDAETWDTLVQGQRVMHLGYRTVPLARGSPETRQQEVDREYRAARREVVRQEA